MIRFFYDWWHILIGIIIGGFCGYNLGYSIVYLVK